VLPTCEVALADISQDALAVARQNITRHDVGDRVRAVESDVFDGLEGQRFDLIVSNPPYVDERDLATMPAEFRHEPALALGAGSDGLDIVRRILREAREHLTSEGWLIVEVGNSDRHVEAAFPEVPFIWLEFERGGQGVFALNAAELDAHAASFA
jgi:ribosomal protein L3 glutamine methyltransferase